MSQLDKTRDNIRVSNMEDNARKELFQKFVDAGGKVVKESRPKPMVFDREKQRAIAEKMDSFHGDKKRTARNRSSITESSVNIETSQNFLDSFINRLILFITGVTSFSGRRIKKSFLDSFADEYKISMMELQMIYLDIFRQNVSIGDRITNQLDQQKPIYFEVIEMTADLYDKTILSELLDTHTAFPMDIKLTNDYKTPLLAYFKKIYPLLPYVSSIYTAYEKAISLQQKSINNSSSSYSVKRKKANNGIYIIFNKMLPRLFRLFCYYHGKNIPLNDSMTIEEILMIGPDLKPGMRTTSSPSRFSENYQKISAQAKAKEEEEKKEAIDELKKKHRQSLSDEIKNGISLMKMLDFQLLKKTYLSNNDIAQQIDDTDPYLKMYLLFLEFDRQYSYILTTNKIKYSIYYDKNMKYDMRSDLLDLFNSMRACEEAAKQYFFSWDNYRKVSSDLNYSKELHLQYSKKVAELEKEKKIMGNALKISIRSFMERLSDKMQFILNDINDINRIISNSKDILEADPEIDPNMKFSGKTVEEAISSVNNYAQALLFRISLKGDLFQEQNTIIENISSNQQKENETDNNQSIIDQLDDLF